MKTILKKSLILAALISIILAGSEEPDGSCNISWTLGWMAVATASCIGASKIKTSKK